MNILHAIPIVALSCVLTCLYSTRGVAQTIDTLSSLSQGSRLVYYRNSDLALQVARFNLAQPGYVTEVRLMLGGDHANGTARLRLFGYEGGLPVPPFEADLCKPLTIKKARPGIEEVVVVLEEPVWIDNSQFFVAVDQLSEGTYLLSDATPKGPLCASGSKEYRYQLLKSLDGSWQSGPYSYAVSVFIKRNPRNSVPFFTDITADALVLEEPLVSGNQSIAWNDVDGNTYPDFLVSGRLFVNNGDETFTEKTDMLGNVGIPDANVFIDINNDKHIDMLFLNLRREGGEPAENRHYIFLNDGSGQFVRRELDINRIPGLSSVSIADINNDGYLDLFVGQNSSGQDDSASHFLLLNDGKSSFADVSNQYSSVVHSGSIISSQWRDIDRNGFPDLFLTGVRDHRHTIWLGDQKSLGIERIVVENSRGEGKDWSGGGDWSDFDNDGVLDLVLSSQVKPLHAKASGATGLTMYTWDSNQIEEKKTVASISTPFARYVNARSGGTWGDVDNDGLVDLFVATACSCNQGDLFVQQNPGKFDRQTYESGLQGVSVGPDAVWVDFNQDGKLDLASFVNGTFRIFKNELISTNAYVSIGLESESANKDGVGAVITVFAGTNRYTREVVSGRGLLMQDPFHLHFGLGEAETIDSIIVQWPNGGAAEKFTDVQINSLNILREGSSRNATGTGSIIVQALPNPFSETLTIAFSLPVKQEVKVEIYSVDGTMVRRVLSENRTEGKHTVTWNRKDMYDNIVPQGVYVYRITGSVSRSASGRAIVVE